jgi:predicted NAD/FAD-dependent oxidoreductase
MATRRRDGAVFDHGAQFFTVRDERFKRWVSQWLALGIVAPWYELGDAGEHYRGVPGMTAVAKHLAEGIDVRRQVTVQKASRTGGEWEVRSSDGAIVAGSALLLTAPVPQALDLLEAGGFELPGDDLAKLRTIRYRRCIAALAVLDRPSALTAHGGSIKLKGEPVQWIADNQRKGVSPSVPAVTIHSTPAFAEKHWETEDALRLPELLAAAAPHVQANAVSCEWHRWGFSEPVGSFDREVFVDAGSRLAIAGDGLSGGRVEGAALSGLAAAEALAAASRLSA